VKAFRPTVAEVDLAAIRHNVATLTPPSCQAMAVVKAGAYGHGDVPVARAALEAGATWLGVALVEEGIRLRDAGIDAPILVLSEFPRGSEEDALAANLTPTLYTEAGLRAVAAAAAATASAPGVHVKLDTGMHRVGLPPERAVEFVGAARDAGLRIEAVWSHLATADEPGHPAVRRQTDAYLRALAQLEAAGLGPRYRHLANSAAVTNVPGSRFDLVRLGVAMYGLSPDARPAEAHGLRPALRWRSAASLVKRVAAGEGVSYGLRYRLAVDSTIVTVPVGYADGYARALSERGRVLVRGRRYPVAGTVCMDQLMVDCGDDPVEPGDEVVLLGPQGRDRITAEEVAGWMGTINYEVVCSIGPRVPRVYP
jgi:alanine racemase